MTGTSILLGLNGREFKLLSCSSPKNFARETAALETLHVVHSSAPPCKETWVLFPVRHNFTENFVCQLPGTGEHQLVSLLPAEQAGSPCLFGEQKH